MRKASLIGGLLRRVWLESAMLPVFGARRARRSSG